MNQQQDLIWCISCGNIAWVLRYQRNRPALMHCRVCGDIYEPPADKLDRHLAAVEELRRDSR